MDVKTLVAKSKAGDVAAFEELIAAHQQKIYNLAYRLTGNYHDANDLAQEAIIRIYKALPNYREDAAFYSWAYSIVTNLYRDFLRKNSRKKEDSLDAPVQLSDDTVERQIESAEQNPEDIYAQKEGQIYLQNLILKLPLEYREIIVYREILGYSYQEIADLFGIALGTVKSRINRARKLLQEKIKQEQYLTWGKLENSPKNERIDKNNQEQSRPEKRLIKRKEG